MYCSHLLMLENVIKKDELIKLQNYLSSLNPNSKKLITVSKIRDVLNIDEKKATEILLSCNKEGFMGISYAIRCPESGLLIQRINDINFVDKIRIYCYKCEDEHEITSEDVIVLFSLEIDVHPFNEGQLETAFDSTDILFSVAPCDTYSVLKDYLKLATISLQNDMASKEYASVKEKRLCEIDYKIKSLDNDIYNKCIVIKEKNKKLIAVICVGLFIIYACVIYRVFTTVDDAKISCASSVTASILVYISDKIVNGLISTDIEYIKSKKKSEVNNAYERLNQERKMIELGKA